MKSVTLKLTVLLFFSFGLSGCMVSGGLIIHPEPIIIGDPPPPPKKVKTRTYQSGKRVAPPPKKRVRIPPGHMPPKGMCRIWYTDRPPGHQPPAGNCRVLKRYVPYNAVLIWG